MFLAIAAIPRPGLCTYFLSFVLPQVPTEEMYRECQELLQMFGLPYIMAPVEVRGRGGGQLGAQVLGGPSVVCDSL
jgi:hypothetical protein